ncbi:MAG: hypothetical protein JXR51_01950 [Bacteroidales bacterium]|nr:hypothetical protein [Bacteroidales bacterium]MBN2755909.1 hypothetical protein [Bacteroidales bacterium]
MKKIYTFKSKIILILIIVIISISLISFSIYNHYLTKKIYSSAEENVVSILHLFKDQYYNIKHDKKSSIALMKKMEEHSWVLNTYLVNADSIIVYPEKNINLYDILNPTKLAALNQEVTLESHTNGSNPYTRIYLKMQNSPNCNQCHNSNIKTIGYMVYDISMREAEKSKVFTLQFSLLYTFLLVLILVFVISVMHYKFVKKSLIHFQNKIKKLIRVI